MEQRPMRFARRALPLQTLPKRTWSPWDTVRLLPGLVTYKKRWKDPPCYLWENSLFLWQFSIAMLNYQRVYYPRLLGITTRHNPLGEIQNQSVFQGTAQAFEHGSCVWPNKKGESDSKPYKVWSKLKPKYCSLSWIWGSPLGLTCLTNQKYSKPYTHIQVHSNKHSDLVTKKWGLTNKNNQKWWLYRKWVSNYEPIYIYILYIITSHNKSWWTS